MIDENIECIGLFCNRCCADLVIGSHFCTECGSPQINIQKVATTAGYDPTGPTFKPWRMKTQQPQFPSLYEKSSSILKTPHPLPWCPPVKSKDLKKRKKKTKKDKEVTDVQKQLQNMLSKDGSELVTIDKNDPNIFYFRGQAFKYSLGNIESKVIHNNTIIETNNDNNDDDDDNNEEIDTMVINPFDLKEVIMPIGIYEATWIFPYKYDYNIHLSLIERKRRDYSFQYWLRIGVSYEDPDGISSDDLQILDIITNNEGHLITPNNKDWVNINDINPSEYYMQIYLQSVMLYISNRVKEVPIFIQKKIDQNCIITTKKIITNNTNDDDEYASRPISRSLAYRAESPPKLVHSDGVYMKDLKTYRFKINYMMNKLTDFTANVSKKQVRSSSSSSNNSSSSSSSNSSSQPNSRPGTTTQKGPVIEVNPNFTLRKVGKSYLYFDKTLSFCCCRIPMGPFYRGKSVLVNARLTVSYYNQATLSYPLPDESNKTMNAPKISHVIITLFPYYSDVKIGPKTVAFEVDTLRTLLPDFRSGIDEMLTNHRQILKLLKSITRLMRYDYTIYGPKLLISGALCPRYRVTLWPTDPDYVNINIVDEEILASAIMLQKIWRSRIGMKKVAGLRMLKAITIIQRVIKRKLRLIRHQKHLQAKINEAKIDEYALSILPAIEDITFEHELIEILIFLQVERLVIDAVFLYEIIQGPVKEKQQQIIKAIEHDEIVRDYERKLLRIEDVDAKIVIYKENTLMLATTKKINDSIVVNITGSFKIYYRDAYNPQARLAVSVSHKLLKQFIFIEHDMLLEVVKSSIRHQHEFDTVDSFNHDDDDDDIHSEKVIERALHDDTLLSLMFETIIAGLEITIINNIITIDMVHTEIMVI